MPAIRSSSNLRATPAALAQYQRETRYIVSINGTMFYLTKTMITFDSPNIFSNIWLCDSPLPPSVEFPRDPYLFGIICNYMKGYDILPLRHGIPPAMTPDLALRNLVLDAEYYGLNHLHQSLTVPAPQSSMKCIGGGPIFPLQDVLEELPVEISLQKSALVWKDGDEKPVMTFAQNMPIVFFAKHGLHRHAHLPEERSSWCDAVDIYLALDSNASPSSGLRRSLYTAPLKRTHAPSDESLWTVKESWQRSVNDTEIWVDGVGGMLKDFTDWWTSLFWAHPGPLPAEHRVFESGFPGYKPGMFSGITKTWGMDFVLWVDEALLTIEVSSEQKHFYEARLHHVKARSRQSILRELSPPTSSWMRDFCSTRAGDQDINTQLEEMVQLSSIRALNPSPRSTNSTLRLQMLPVAGSSRVATVDGVAVVTTQIQGNGGIRSSRHRVPSHPSAPLILP